MRFAFMPHIETQKPEKAPKRNSARIRAKSCGVGTQQACDYAELFYPGLKLPSLLRKRAQVFASNRAQRRERTKQVAIEKAVEREVNLSRVFLDSNGEEIIRVELQINKGQWIVTRENEDFPDEYSKEVFSEEKRDLAHKLYNDLLRSEAKAQQGRQVSEIKSRSILI